MRMRALTGAQGNSGLLFGLKKEENPAVCRDRDEPGGHHTKRNQPELEDKHCKKSLVYGLFFFFFGGTGV
jgi:hypothetical protein